MNLLEKYGLTERFATEATMYPELTLARVIAQYSEKYKIVTDNNELLSEISGKFQYNANELTDYPTVGDYVMVKEEKDYAIIHQILTRKSLFVRKAVGVSNQAQAVASNVDYIFLCMSMNQNYNLNRMERYLSIAWDSGAIPVVVLTKTDLCDDLEKYVSEIEKISNYSDVITLSMYDNNIIDKFSKYFTKNQTCTFIGSSGVGKSTLINKLLGNDIIKTNEIGQGDKGKHTTTNRAMYPCPLGGVVIDTPGMREMGIDSADISTTFSEIEKLISQCRFSDCTHTNEPGCAVLSAIESGELDIRRFESFKKLQNEASYDGLSSKEIEKKKLERMFKDVGGMEKMRKFVRENDKRKI